MKNFSKVLKSQNKESLRELSFGFHPALTLEDDGIASSTVTGIGLGGAGIRLDSENYWYTTANGFRVGDDKSYLWFADLDNTIRISAPVVSSGSISASRIEGARSAAALVRSSKMLTTACVVAKLPAESKVITRSPGIDQVFIFLKTEMLSTPALVRVSDINKSPAFNLRPTQ